MRMDVNKIPFSAIVQGGALVTVDVRDCFQVGFAVDIDSVAGSPTNYRAVAVAFEDQEVGSPTEHIRKTDDMTAPGIYYLGQRGSAVGEIGFENVYKKIRVIADFTGGSTPSMTGSIYVFTKRF